MTQTTPHNPPQQSLSNTHATNAPQIQATVQFQTTTPTRQSILQILAYTPAQNTQPQSIQTCLTIKTLHFYALPNLTTPRNLSRPPLQTIPTNPLSYRLTSTIPNSTQHSKTNNNQLNTLSPFSTTKKSNMTRNMLQNSQFQTSNPPSTTIRTNPHINIAYTQPFTNTPNISSIVSNVPTNNTVPPSAIPQSTVSHSTYINSSTSIFEPIKPFDGLYHDYTLKE